MEPVANAPLEKKVIRSSPLLWILSAGLCGFLCSLGTQAMWDVAELVPHVDEDAVRARHTDPVGQARQRLDDAPNPHQDAVLAARRTLEQAETELSSAEANFRNWLAARGTIGPDGQEDAQIRARRQQLEQLRAARDGARRALEAAQAGPDPIADQRRALELRAAQVEREASDELEALERVRNLKALGLRLLVVAPVWLLAAWFWRTKRQSAYVTLLWGYWAFALWMLVWGVEPYLPHYGGYARYALAIAIIVWAAVSLVRWMNARAGARRQRIVEKAIARHRCPSCERGYLVGRETELQIGLARKATTRHFDQRALRPFACAFCGERLFGACATCDHEQPVHLDHCAACNAPWAERAPAAPPNATLP